MFILGLNGSPNVYGNTKFLLEKVMEGASNKGADTMILDIAKILGSAKNEFCVACSNPCSGICYKGTQLEDAFEYIKKADALVIGSPSYFGSVTGQIKAFFDKTRKLRAEKVLYNKVGAGVTVGGSRFGGQETTMKALHDIMLVQGMIVVGDGYIDDDCGHHGVSAQRPAQGDENSIKRADILGKRLVEVGMAMKLVRE